MMKANKAKAERVVYLILIIVLAFYGLKDSESAVKLIKAITEAFSVLFNNQTL